MDTREKRRLELKQQRDKRREEIKDAAIREFMESGIENSKIADIAKKAEVGEATVYRYFESKPKLVIECAVKVWENQVSTLDSIVAHENSKNLSGFAKIKIIFNLIGSIYKKAPQLLRVLEQFESYIVKEKIPREQLQGFDVGIVHIRSMIMKIIREGQRDGSIRREIDGTQFYITAVQTISALSQKLMLYRDILKDDEKYHPSDQLADLIDMELFYIKGSG